MANNHKVFTEFNKTIRLTDSKRNSLKTSRTALRRRIKNYFDENKPDEIKPKFYIQGSFAMDTIVNPIPKTVEIDGKAVVINKYDVDDGVYFIGDENITDRKTIQTYHNWIVDAVNGHTNTPPIDKSTCVRVEFSDGHHIDLPIYYKQDDTPELAHKRAGWTPSDPRGFTDWFNGHASINSQLKRVVRYLKAWRDYREYSNSSVKMPSGLILSILAAENFYPNERDDISLKETLILIESKLNAAFECYRPTTPSDEDLLADYNNKDYFLNLLGHFIDDAKAALEESNKNKSCLLWQKHFGDRFSCGLVEDEDEENQSSARLGALVGSSRPWSSDG